MVVLALMVAGQMAAEVTQEEAAVVLGVTVRKVTAPAVTLVAATEAAVAATIALALLEVVAL